MKTKVDFKIDADYYAFLTDSNGAECYINDSYIVFWNIEDLLVLNPYYEDIDACNKIFFFGSDGSNYGYGFLKNSGEVVGIDFLDISHKKPEVIAESFELFLKQLNGNVNS